MTFSFLASLVLAGDAFATERLYFERSVRWMDPEDYGYGPKTVQVRTIDVADGKIISPENVVWSVEDVSSYFSFNLDAISHREDFALVTGDPRKEASPDDGMKGLWRLDFSSGTFTPIHIMRRFVNGTYEGQCSWLTEPVLSYDQTSAIYTGILPYDCGSGHSAGSAPPNSHEDILTVPLGGDAPEVVISWPGDQRSPAVSSRGQLAFWSETSADGASNPGIYVQDQPGGPVRLAVPNCSFPQWSDTSSHIACGRDERGEYDDTLEHYAFDAATGERGDRLFTSTWHGHHSWLAWDGLYTYRYDKTNDYHTWYMNQCCGLKAARADGRPLGDDPHLFKNEGTDIRKPVPRESCEYCWAETIGDLATPAVYGQYSSTSGALPDAAARFSPQLRFDSSDKWRPLSVDTLLTERAADGQAAQRLCIPYDSEDASTYAPPRPTFPSEEFYGDSTAESLAAGSLVSAYCPAGLPDLERIPSEDAYIDINGLGPSREAGRYRAQSPRCALPKDLQDCDSGPDSIGYFALDIDAQASLRGVAYWYFYRYNEFSAGLGAGNHEGDWEGLYVAPDASGNRIQYVAFSQHTRWFHALAENVDCADSGADCSTAGTHPTSFVANGSHANYPGACSETVAYVPGAGCWQDETNIPTPERGHDGARPWARSFSDEAALQPLGTWDNWPGRWGIEGGGPRSPSFQMTAAAEGLLPDGAIGPSDGLSSTCPSWVGPTFPVAVCADDELAESVQTRDFEASQLRLISPDDSVREQAMGGVLQVSVAGLDRLKDTRLRGASGMTSVAVWRDGEVDAVRLNPEDTSEDPALCQVVPTACEP